MVAALYTRTRQREYMREYRASRPNYRQKCREYERVRRESGPAYSEKHKDALAKHRRQRIEVMRGYKLMFGCRDCSYVEDVTKLHLHHRPGETYSFKPSDVSGRPWHSLWAEWAKCDVLCIWCHQLAHHLGVTHDPADRA